MEFFDLCLAIRRRAAAAGISRASCAGMLLEYSLLRLTKTGASSGYPGEWGELLSEELPRIRPIPEEAAGDTVTLHRPIHPGAAWSAARGVADFSAAIVPQAATLLEDGHRNAAGLFDDPASPGHLSTEIPAMTVPVLAWAAKCGGGEAFRAEAVRQMEGYAAALCDPETRLWHSETLPDGSLAPCGGYGGGYALFALSELIYDLPAEDGKKQDLIRMRAEMLTGVLPYQDPAGMWHRTVDDPESPPDVPGTAWILYAMERAIKQNAAESPELLAACHRGLAGLAGYLTCDGNIFDGRGGPGGEKNAPGAFAPVLLALQQAGYNEFRLKMMMPLSELLAGGAIRSGRIREKQTAEGTNHGKQ